MSKVDVILIANVVGLGAESDPIKVSAGYARNYLFPQKLAIPLTAANKRRIVSLKQRRGEREASELNAMTDLAKTISKITLPISVKTGEGNKMFGSITAGTIAEELKHQYDVALDKHKIHLEKPIKTLGDHEVELRLHADVIIQLKVHVQGTNPDAQPAPVAAAPASATKPEAKKEGGKEGADRKPRPAKADKAVKAAPSEKSAKGGKA